MQQTPNRVLNTPAKSLIPSNRDLTRLIESRRAQHLGFELPLTVKEAADYIRVRPKAVKRMARLGEIPAHPVSGVRRQTWRFYPSELDSWLQAKLNPPRRSQSPMERQPSLSRNLQDRQLFAASGQEKLAEVSTIFPLIFRIGH